MPLWMVLAMPLTMGLSIPAWRAAGAPGSTTRSEPDGFRWCDCRRLSGHARSHRTISLDVTGTCCAALEPNVLRLLLAWRLGSS